MISRPVDIGMSLMVLLALVAGPASANVPSTRVDPSEGDSRIYFARRLDGDKGWSILSISPLGEDERIEVPYESGMGEYNPALSPDGRMLMFNTYRYGGWKLATRVPGGGEVTRWSPGSDYYTNGVFAPDGSAILYEAHLKTGTDIHMRSVSGESERNLTPSFGSSDERGPVWMPDGNTFVFFGDLSGRQQIYSAGFTGENPRNLSRSKGNDFAPAVSPEGGRIAFYSDRDGHADLFVMSADGTGQTNLTADLRNDDTGYSFKGRTYWVFKCSWSPDGQELVFVSPVDGNYELFTIRSDGSALKRLTKTTAAEITPAWGSPVQRGP